MTDVANLMPGDEVHQAGMSAVYVEQTCHPLWPRLRLVIWKLDDGTWSHDALDLYQDVGTVTSATADLRRERLRLALLGQGGR